MRWTLLLLATLLAAVPAQAQPKLTPPAARDLPLLCTSYALFAVEMAGWRDAGVTIIATNAHIMAWDTSKGFRQDIRTIHAQIIWYVYGHPRIRRDRLEVVMYAACEAWRQGKGLFPNNARETLEVLTRAETLGH